MGVYIFLYITPHQIDSAHWESVYEESLELIEAYPFLDYVVDRDTYGCDWGYVDRAKERRLPSADGAVGWHMFGDETSMMTAESFTLYKDLQWYRKRASGNPQSGDIFFTLIHRHSSRTDHFRSFTADDVAVFDAKTQGHPFHIPLLAIACLIESRFPGRAVVFGDVTLGQMQEAVKWANTILKRPIGLTDRVSNDKLLHRVRQMLQDEAIALEAWMELTLQEKHAAMGDFIRTHFNQAAISAYFTEQFKQLDVQTIGFRDSLASYFNQGYRLEDACEMCVLDPNGCRFDPAEFAETVLSLDWGSGESGPDPFSWMTINDPHNPEPETIPSLFGKMLFQFAGVQERMKSSLTYPEVVAVLRDKLGHVCDMDSLSDKYRKTREQEAEQEVQLRDELQAWEREEARRNTAASPSNGIAHMEDLIAWKQGDAIHPHILAALAKLKDFVSTQLKDNEERFLRFQQLSEHMKMRMLIAYNKHFDIHKKSWDLIIGQLNDVRMSNAVLAVLSVRADEINVNRLCKAVVNNPELLKTYII